MTIKIGEKLPEVTLVIATADGPKPTPIAQLFDNKKIALFSVPGAFTPTCSARHLPSFVEHGAELKAKGIDTVLCMSVNDAFVMTAWAKSQNITDEVTMIADGNASFAKALGLDFDGSAFGMGTRSQRFAMVVDNGTVTHLFVEAGGEYKVSSAEHMLANL